MKRAGLKLSVQNTKITASSSIASWQIDGEKTETVTDFIFLGSKITAAMKLKETCSLEGKLWQTWKCINQQRHNFADKGQSYGFSGSHIQMWELHHKEGWVLKNLCFQIVLLEKTLEESLRLQGNQTSQS